jgi:ParB family chromosome partitioning protein
VTDEQAAQLFAVAHRSQLENTSDDEKDSSSDASGESE